MLKNPRIGDKLCRVEWCSKLAFYEDSDDVDRDRCTTSYKHFPADQIANAKKFAESVYHETACNTLGIVEVDMIEFVPYDEDDAARLPHVGYWESVTDADIFAGEWETA